MAQYVKMILTNGFDPDTRVYKEAKKLVQIGYDVEILCWDRENKYADKETELFDGIKIKRFFPYSKYGTSFKQLKPFYKFIHEVKEYLKSQKYQYLHCHDLDGMIVGYIAITNEAKIIFDMHEIYEINGNKQKLRYLVRAVVNHLQNRADSIIYVNDAQTKIMSPRNKRKSIYLPNYPEKDNYNNCVKSKSEKLRISYIGAVRQYNELKSLMDACSKMDEVEINIHGAGVSYEKVRDIAHNYGNVNVTGKYDYKHSAELYGQTDILYALYPINNIQYCISYPIKLFEAIITKTPIIVSKETVLEDFINENGIGFAVDGSDNGEIRKLIEDINKNRHLLDEKIKNLGIIQFKYCWEEVCKNLEQIYN